MSNTPNPQFVTDSYFGLADRWLETAPGEITHFHDLGDGEPVLFLHGSGAGVSAAANWWLNLHEIAKTHRTIAIDLIGFGQTVIPEGTDFGIQEWVAHTVRVMDALGIEKTWLVGNSLGGWVAFQFALEYPDRLLGVISMGTGGAKKTAQLASHARPELTIAGIRKALTDFVVDPSLVTDDLVRARYNAAFGEHAFERFRQVVIARDRDREQLPLDLGRLSEFTAPVLLIHGREDSVIPMTRSLQLFNVLPHADLTLFSQCGHWSQVERATEFNKTVTQFVQTHS